MTAFRFPFWIVTQRQGTTLKPVQPAGMAGLLAVFPSAEHAAAFRENNGGTQREVRLVSRGTLQEMLPELRQLGIKGLCLDPDREGGGTPILFEELG